MNKIVVYTVLAGEYDDIKSLQFKTGRIDYVCITNSYKKTLPKPWKKIVIDSNGLSNKDFNRFYKINAHEALKDYDISLYIDANVRVLKSPYKIIVDSIKDCDLAAYKHFERDCVYSEADVCIRKGLEYAWKFEQQLNRYKNENYKSDELLECNIIFRRHMVKNVVDAMNIWWDEYLKGAKRDQISAVYSFRKANLKYKNLGLGNIRNGNEIFFNDHHIPSKKKTLNRFFVKLINNLYLMMRK